MRTVSIAAAILLVSRLAHGDPTSAVDFIRARHEKIRTLIASSDTRLGSVLDETLDYDVFVEKSLGPHWAALTPQQRADFRSVLRKLIRNSYERNVRSIAENAVNWESVSDTVVHSVAVGRTDTVDVDYVLERRNDKFFVVDVVVEGASLVGNYRRQFDRIIRKSGADDLLRKMREKLEKDKA